MTELMIMLGLGAVCWLFRTVFVLAVPAERMPAVARRALEYLAPAVLAAIAAVELTSVVSTRDLYGSALALLAMALVALIAHRFRNLSITVAAALVAILLIDLVVR